MTEKMLGRALRITLRTINSPEFAKLPLEDQKQVSKANYQVTDQLLERKAMEEFRRAKFDAYKSLQRSQKVILIKLANLHKEHVAV